MQRETKNYETKLIKNDKDIKIKEGKLMTFFIDFVYFLQGSYNVYNFLLIDCYFLYDS